MSIPDRGHRCHHQLLFPSARRSQPHSRRSAGPLRREPAREGFTFEYSATFGQAIDTARDSELLAEYSRAIIFDYSYRYSHGDGYGKEYWVLNLREDRDGWLPDERRKVVCGERHFQGALGVDYEVVVSAGELP